MRVFSLSDIHVDFDANASWVEGLSRSDYQRDILLLAGDVSDSQQRFSLCIEAFARRFRKVFFVPGNHDLWVLRDAERIDSLEKFARVKALVLASGASMNAEVIENVAIVPLLGWYDYSFGVPDRSLLETWMDFRACRWPAGWTEQEITSYFIDQNPAPPRVPAGFTISFSHFLPRVDVMPGFIPPAHRRIYPVLGSNRLETLIRAINPAIHLYGHSHVNQDVVLDGIRYINNAFAYPHEERIAAKALRCIYRTD
ncbi:metallophosphoesterase [Janthinobacterium sp.]|uniref:metallophosphoesterase n=1 Tax=Janthinobacterium sp. TaxID=1871054 RepID=UPI0025831BBD|nr:metallophosphoesterase [Janthinobacterium sp.]MCX7293721.1 metallophosphoesterase [Janthinobacterium sp.]